MTDRNFASFTTERANAGDMVHPCGRQTSGAEPLSAESWRGISNYADTLNTSKKTAGTRSALQPSKTLNTR